NASASTASPATSTTAARRSRPGRRVTVVVPAGGPAGSPAVAGGTGPAPDGPGTGGCGGGCGVDTVDGDAGGPTPSPRRRGRPAGNRAAGSFGTRPRTPGPGGPARRGGGNSSSTIARSVLSGVSCRNGEEPSTAAYSSTPSDHRSDSGPGVRPRARSGARNSGEPTTSPVIVSAELPSTIAMPKSVSTTRPSLAISTLAGFTSRCSTPAACAARSAASTSAPIPAARAGDIGPSASSTSASDRPRTSSITIHGR